MSENEIVKDGICYMCTHTCPTRIHVQNGRAVKIDIANDKLAHCPRWKAQLDFVYHPDRLKHPLKRTGNNNNGAYTRISWDEALDTVAENLQEVRDNFGPESVVFWVAYTCSGSVTICSATAYLWMPLQTGPSGSVKVSSCSF